jgi:hypothetical protein
MTKDSFLDLAGHVWPEHIVERLKDGVDSGIWINGWPGWTSITDGDRVCVAASGSLSVYDLEDCVPYWDGEHAWITTPYGDPLQSIAEIPSFVIHEPEETTDEFITRWMRS